MLPLLATWPDRKRFPRELRSWFPYLRKLKTKTGYKAFPQEGFLTGHGMFTETLFYIWEDGQYKADLASIKAELKVSCHISMSHCVDKSFNPEIRCGAGRTTQKSRRQCCDGCRWRCRNGRSHCCTSSPGDSDHNDRCAGTPSSPGDYSHHHHRPQTCPQTQAPRSWLPRSQADEA